MHLFSRGDVVLAWYYWRNSSGSTDGGYRPVVIKELIYPDKYLVIKITRTARVGLYRVRAKSKIWDSMGLYDDSTDSYIDKDASLEISEGDINEKLGSCPPEVFAHLWIVQVIDLEVPPASMLQCIPQFKDLNRSFKNLDIIGYSHLKDSSPSHLQICWRVE